MIGDIGQIAAAAVSMLAPFTPFLIDTGKAGGQKLAEVIAEKGGEAAWNKAKALWDICQANFDDDMEVKGSTMMLAARPNDESRQTTLAEILGTRLHERPEIAEKIFEMIGREQAVQQVLANRGSWVEQVVQSIKGTVGGSQLIRATDNSTIKNVQQKIE